jgi:RHS repeat-associated protein
MVTVPATVLIPEGATSATFPIATGPIHGTRDRAAEIDATYNGITQTATLTIAPPITAGSRVRKPIAQCASLALEPCLTVAGLRIATDAITITEARYSFYTPELQLLAETAYSTESAKTIEYEYIWFSGQPLAQIETTTGAVHYYFNDHLGTPILTTDVTGAIDWRVEREPYGSRYGERFGANRHQPLGLPGQEEPENGSEALYNVFRWYRSGWGRYTQADPIGSSGTPYAYAGANPERLIDRLGLLQASIEATEFEGTELIQKACKWTGGKNPFSYGAGLKGCTIFTNLSITCSCSNKGPCAWYPEISVNAGLKVWYATNAVQVNPPYKYIPPEMIISEEMKHVKVALGFLGMIEKQGDKLQQQRFGSKGSCNAACTAYTKNAFQLLGTFNDWVHEYNPHPDGY